MKLLQIKIRELGSGPCTDWLHLSPHVNKLKSKNHSYQTRILTALETINPPFSCQKKEPFGDLPLEIQQNGYTKKIYPHKRTISLGVFAAPPQLVTDLGQISEFLYETDRIEVGRRLDYSKWLNFVELSSSSRWSEVSESFRVIAQAVQPSSPELVKELGEFTVNLAPEVRIKNDLMDKLSAWLTGLPPLPVDLKSARELTHEAVLRAAHFHRARHLVYQRLPLITSVDPADSLTTLLSFISQKAQDAEKQSSITKNLLIKQLNEQLTIRKSGQPDYVLQESAGRYLLSDKTSPATSSANSKLNRLKASVTLARAISNVIYQTQPILLFIEPDRYISREYHANIIQFLSECAEESQCLCSFASDDFSTMITNSSTNQGKRRAHCINVDKD